LCHRFEKMPGVQRNSSDVESGIISKRRTKVCGSASLNFLGRLDNSPCHKEYFYIRSTAGFQGPNDASQALSNKAYLALVAPIDATSLTVAWTFNQDFETSNLTRCIISVEREAGCKLVPIVKFQLPVSLVPQNDCECAERLVSEGVTQSFRVQICAGDLIFVSGTRFLAENCPVQCGVADLTPPDISTLYVFQVLVCLS
jgi:hypothetical protein